MDVPNLVHPGELTASRPHRPWYREPLLHFVVLGAALFALQRWVAPPPPDEIVVSTEVQNGLRQDHERRFGKPPTPEQEQELIDHWVEEEMLVREALRLGLDRGDAIVRRRLLQKMEFLNETATPVPAPTDAELQAWLDAHPDRYAVSQRVSFTHVFIAADAHPDPDAVAADLARQLAEGVDPAHLGDPFVRGRDFPLQSEREVAGIFGPAFAAAVMRLAPGEWSSPIRSSYGLHLVKVRENAPGRRGNLGQVRKAVTDDWTEAKREEAVATSVARLKARYRVRNE